MTCAECSTDFIPDTYERVCNACGDELTRQFEQMQVFDDGELTLAEVAARAAGLYDGWWARRRWRVG